MNESTNNRWDWSMFEKTQLSPAAPTSPEPDPLGNYEVVEVGGARILVGIDSGVAYVPVEPNKPFWFNMWEPTPQMVEFFRSMLRLLRPLTPWHVPATGNVYIIDKERQTFTLVEGKVDEWHWKNVKTLAKLGYRVLVVQQSDTGSGKIEHTPT